MKKKFRIPLVVAIALLLCMMVPIAGYAAEKSEEVGFSVSAVLPENQADSGVSYFDLQMEPGQKQDLRVQVYNENAEEIKVKAEAISASTNRNGIIDYKTSNVKDETLKIPFSEIAEVRTPLLTIPGGGTQTAIVSVEMPKEEYDGTVLGGIVLTQVKGDGQEQPESTREVQQGVYIDNEYSYVLGVKLQETNKAVLPAFEGIKAQPELVNYRVNVVHYIRNSEAAIAKNAEVSIEIYSESEQKAVKTDAKTIDMAPNSVMPYAVSWGAEIAPGKYVSHVLMKQADREWNFDLPFEVSAQTAQQINHESVEEKQAMPWWVLLLIVLIILLIVVIVILLIMMKRKKRDAEEDTIGTELTRTERRRRK